jgi:TolB protein
MNKPVLPVVVLACTTLLALGVQPALFPAVLAASSETQPADRALQSQALPSALTYSSDGKKVAFEAIRDGHSCAQIYVANADGSGVHIVSSGDGTATGPSFFPGGAQLLYSATRQCPPASTGADGFAIFPTSHIFIVNADGSGRKQLTAGKAYNAEAAAFPDGQSIVFTSTRDGDPEVYRMDTSGGHLERLTAESGYDGAPLPSPDGQWIAYRASHPATPAELAAYRELLKRGQVRLPHVELWLMRSDGSAKRQLTNSSADFAPYFSADGKSLMYGTKFTESGSSAAMDLYSFQLDGTGPRRITHNFESPDDRKLKQEEEAVFAANQLNRERLRETKPFGLLKLLAYSFAGLALVLVLVRTGLAALVVMKQPVFRLQQFLFWSARALGLSPPQQPDALAKALRESKVTEIRPRPARARRLQSR